MRPYFIESEQFRAYLKPTALNKLMRVNGILPTSYLLQREAQGCPIRYASRKGVKHYRALDIVAHARAYCHEVSPLKQVEMIMDINILQAVLDDQHKYYIAGKHVMTLNRASKSPTDGTLLPELEIVGSQTNYEVLTGIYFLINEERVMYVGQSINIHNRLADHKRAGKKFTGWAYLSCAPIKELLDALESLYIHVLNPPYNGRVNANTNEPSAPLRLHELLALRGIKCMSCKADANK